MELTNKQIENYKSAVSDVAFSETTPQRTRNKLVEVLDLLDELQIAGAIYTK